MPWRGWPTTGRRTGRRASMFSAPTCACRMTQTPAKTSPPGDRARHYRANREVRHTIIRLICTHLRPGAVVSWQGRNLDFTGVAFDGGDFFGAVFSGGTVDFIGAQFSGGEVNFSRVADWSHPPEFSWGGSPPSGVRLPAHDGGEP